MEITPIQNAPATQPAAAGPNAAPHAAENRDIARATRTLNEEGVAGPGREFSFSVDPKTKIAIVRIVDAATGELINQFPSDYILQVAKELEEFRSTNPEAVR